MTLEHLILMRHGETTWNREQRLQGHRDIPLSDVGAMQAADAAPSVGALRPEVIVSSDLVRARQTADAVSSLVDRLVTVDARLRETSMGKWEGLTRDEVIADWEQEWNDWRTTSAHASPPGGESRWQVAARAAAVVEELDAGEVSRALLVSHGGTIVGLTGRLLVLPEDSWGTLIGVGNCHWVVLHRYAGAWRLHSYNAGLGGLVLPRGEDQVAGT
ncbi:MAG TPA: histidine phosphatase family protein [Nakamurella sp.]